MGGSGGDLIDAGLDGSRDVVLGDNGIAIFDIVTIDEGPTDSPVDDVLRSVLQSIVSEATDVGGNDTIVVGNGDDVVIAGVGTDYVNFSNGTNPMPIGIDEGADVILGDNGEATFDTSTGVSLLEEIHTTAAQHGAGDFIFAGNGPDTVLGGSGGDVIDAGTDGARDVVLGDNGKADFDIVTLDEGPTDSPIDDIKVSVLATIESTDTSVGGKDNILVGDGDDVVIGGVDDDRVNYSQGPNPVPVGTDEGADVILGDNGKATFDTTTGESLLTDIETTAFTDGGDDLIFAANGPDVVLGGSGSDVIDAGLDASRDIVLGDNGTAHFDIVTIDGDKKSVLQSITSTATNIDTDNGKDEIIVGDGDDFVIAGVDDDRVNYRLDSLGNPVQVGNDTGADVVLGDSGEATFDTSTGESLAINVKTIDATNGPGDDLIFTDEGADIVLGGSGNDVIDAGLTDDARDIVLGDNGEAAFDILTINGETISVLQNIKSTDTDVETDNGKDNIVVGDGDDVVIAGVDDDRVNYSQGPNPVPVGSDEGADVILGDSGEATFDTSTGESLLDIIFTTTPAHGGDDLIFADNGPDVVLGGSGNDVIDAGFDASNDVVLGDNGIADFDLVDIGNGLTSVLTEITSTATDIGGKDEIIVGDGDDVVIAGVDDDRVNYRLDDQGNPVQVGVDSGDDVVIGDNGTVDFDTTTGAPLVLVAMTTSPEQTGDDLIFTDNGSDVVLAGSGNDLVDAENETNPDEGADVVLGDNGTATWDLVDVNGVLTPVLTHIVSAATDVHVDNGKDVIIVGDGDDVVIGGVDDDLVNYEIDATTGEPVQVGVDDGDDVVIGDNGEVDFDTTTGAPLVTEIKTIDPTNGPGDDMIFTDNGSDIVLAGSGNDVVDAENETNPDEGVDVVLGDNGIATFDLVDVGEGPTSVLTHIVSTATDVGGDDVIIVGDGDDFVIAGVGDDLVNYEIDPTTGEPVQVGLDDGDDVVIGDNGHADFDTATGAPLATLIETTAPLDGGDDMIFTDNGNDIVLAGSGNDVVDAENETKPDEGVDIVLGDNGRVEQDLVDTGAGPITVLQQITSTATDIGGDDVIIVGDGDDVVIAGVGNDLVNYEIDPATGEPVQVTEDDGADIVIGDNGQAMFETSTGMPLLEIIMTTAPESGGDDFIFTADGPDIVLGGSGSDVIDADGGAPVDSVTDIVIGDNGIIVFDTSNGGSRIIGLSTTAPADGGKDIITTGFGDDIVFGGTSDDTIQASGGFANDLVVGDNGTALWVDGVLRWVTTIDPAQGGDDYIVTGSGLDVVLAGTGNDFVDAGTNAGGDIDRDIVLGDNGVVHFNQFGQSTLIYTTDPLLGGDDFIMTGGGIDTIFGGSNSDFLDGGLDDDLIFGDNGFVDFNDSNGNAGEYQLAYSTNPGDGGHDYVLAGGGNDTVFGGSFSDIIYGGSGNDLLLGDHGLFDRSLPRDQQFRSIMTGAGDFGGDDEIHGDNGPGLDGLGFESFDDVILGQQGDDLLFGGIGDDDITGGHNVVNGDDGDDRIDGGDGADVVIGDNGQIRRILTGIDLDTYVRYPAPFSDVIRTITLFDNIDKIGGNDHIFGGEGRDILHGQRGADRIDGQGGDDNIFGELGSDVIFGGDGHDVVLAEAGQILPVFNADGTPMVNPDGSWRRTIVLEDEGVIV